MRQGIDAGQAVGDAELRREDRAEFPGPERADAVLRRRAGIDAAAEAFDLVRGEVGGLAGAWAIAEGLGPLDVVAGDPGLDRSPGVAGGLCDLRRGVALGGEDDGSDADGPAFVGLLIGPAAESVEGHVVGDVHGWGSLGFPSIIS